MNRSDLVAFLAKALEGCPDARFTLVHVVHLSEGEGSSPIVTVRAPAVRDLPQVAEEFMKAARDDAADTSGAQRYAVVAYDGKDPIGRQGWRVAGERLISEVMPTEPASVAGITAQLMRHTEAMVQTVVKLSGSSQGTMLDQIQRLERENEALRKRELEVMELLERLVSQDHTRKLEERKVMGQLELRSKAFAKLEPLIPVLMARIFKQPVPAAGDSVIASAIDAFISTITPEQAASLESILTPEQRMGLAELYRQGRERAQASERANAPQEHVNGAASEASS